MDSLNRHALTGIERLEYELIVRDFISVLNSGAISELAPFLHEDVVYRPSSRQVLRGRPAVLSLCEDLAGSFDTFCIEMLDVAVSDDVVLAEEWTRLQLPGTAPAWVMGFSSYRMTGFRISEWRRVHA